MIRKPIIEMKLTVRKSSINVNEVSEILKKKIEALKTSIVLLHRIEESNDEKHIIEYKKLFKRLLKENSKK